MSWAELGQARLAIDALLPAKTWMCGPSPRITLIIAIEATRKILWWPIAATNPLPLPRGSFAVMIGICWNP